MVVVIPKPLVYVSMFGTFCGGAYLFKWVPKRAKSSLCTLPRFSKSFCRFSFFIFSCRDYLSGKDYKCRVSAADKVVVVTGANTGLGKETTRMLAIKNATVVMACRDMEKCEKVIERVSTIELYDNYVLSYSSMVSTLCPFSRGIFGQCYRKSLSTFWWTANQFLETNKPPQLKSSGHCILAFSWTQNSNIDFQWRVSFKILEMGFQ